MSTLTPDLYGDAGPITGGPSGAVIQGGMARQPVQGRLAEATDKLDLTPQEQNLYRFHLANLNGPGKVTQPDGEISTLLQRVVRGPGGKYYNIPSVWDGRVLSEEQAKARAARIGWDNWPSYSSAKAADARYEKMHEFIDQDTGDYEEQMKGRGQ